MSQAQTKESERESGTTSYREKGILKSWNKGSFSFRSLNQDQTRPKNPNTSKTQHTRQLYLRRHESKPPSDVVRCPRDCRLWFTPLSPVYTHWTDISYREITDRKAAYSLESQPQVYEPLVRPTAVLQKERNPSHQPSLDQWLYYLIWESECCGALKIQPDHTSKPDNYSRKRSEEVQARLKVQWLPPPCTATT